MKKIIIIILLAVTATGIMGFTLAKKDTKILTTKTTEEIHPLPNAERMKVINLMNEEQWN